MATTWIGDSCTRETDGVVSQSVSQSIRAARGQQVQRKEAAGTIRYGQEQKGAEQASRAASPHLCCTEYNGKQTLDAKGG